MKVEESVNEIKITEAPGCLWIFGLFFVIIGSILAYGAFGGFTNWSEVPAWQIAVAIFISVSVIWGGVWVISSAPVTKVVIDRIEDRVVVVQYGFFGKRRNSYHFEEIRHFQLIEETDSDSDQIWFLGLSLKTGEMIKITSLAMHSEDIQQKYVFQCNEFMRKQIPSALDIDD